MRYYFVLKGFGAAPRSQSNRMIGASSRRIVSDIPGYDKEIAHRNPRLGAIVMRWATEPVKMKEKNQIRNMKLPS